MLFRPPPHHNPAAVQALLDAWNVEADDFRRLARAALVTDQAMSSTVLAAEDIYEELSSLLDELDEALGRVPSGSRLFTQLLHTQVKATALHESIANTLDILDRCTKIGVNGPTIIGPAALDADLLSSNVSEAA